MFESISISGTSSILAPASIFSPAPISSLVLELILSILFSKAFTSDVAIACELIFDPITELSIKSESALTSAAETDNKCLIIHLHLPP